MTYNMKVNLINPNIEEGMEREIFFDLTCDFFYDKDQYGNGHYVSIKGYRFNSEYIDLRYDKDFNRNEKDKWLETWARGYWSGKNGAWAIKTLEIIKL